MNLNHLRAFYTVAEAGNITRAALQLKVSQPAISKQLAELESQLGHDLFDRLPRGVRLTAAGEVLRAHAQHLFAAEKAAEAELAELAGVRRGSLAIGASTTIGNYLIPSVFGTYHKEHPEIRLTLEIANTAAIQTAVIENRLDLGLIEGFVASDVLEVEVIHEDEMVLIVAPDHPLTRRSRVRAKDLTQTPFIMRETGSGTREVIEAALADAGIAIETAMDLGSTEAVKKAVAAGIGAAMVSRLTIDPALARGQLAIIELDDLRIRRDLHLIQLKGKRPSHALGAFMHLLHGTLHNNKDL